jgi:hypothetical protein
MAFNGFVVKLPKDKDYKDYLKAAGISPKRILISVHDGEVKSPDITKRRGTVVTCTKGHRYIKEALGKCPTCI